MKITFFIGGLGKGGAERVVCNLANYLVSHHEIDILTVGDEEAYVLDDRIHRIKLIQNHERKNMLMDSLRRMYRLLRYLSKKRDVFVVMLPFTTILLLKLRVLLRGKIIASERSYPTYYSKKEQSQLRNLAHRADAWIFQTQASMAWYKNILGNAQYRIIANPINEKYVSMRGTGVRTNNIISVGRLTEVKNHSLLLKAFSIVSKDFKDYNLIIYGEGPLCQTLQSEAFLLGVENQVAFPGFVEWGELSKDAGLFILTSDKEGMPNTLMEAMALGLPCISTDCDGGGAAYLIENERNGLLVPKGDVDALANAMRRMLSDKVFANKCGNEAKKICERLAPEKIYGEWESFIKKVCNK